MDDKTAAEVLQAVREEGFLEDGAYAHSENIVEEADYWVSEAEKILSAGVDEDIRPSVERILTVGKIEFSTPHRSSGGYSEADLRSKDEEKGETKKDTELDEQMKAAVDNDSYREGLPLPPEIEGDVKQLPRDLTSLKDVQVRQLSGEYLAVLNRVTWLLAQEMSDLANAETMFDAAKRKAMIAASRPVVEGEKKLRDIIESEALQDAEVQQWSDRLGRHKGEAIRLRALKDIYSGNIDRLSREWTMRTDEYERSK